MHSLKITLNPKIVFHLMIKRRKIKNYNKMNKRSKNQAFLLKNKLKLLFNLLFNQFKQEILTNIKI
jgi:hypothetical protein